MADATGLLPRHLMRGTADADRLHVAELVSFDWVPDPGDTAHSFYDEVGHVAGTGPSRATGQAVFEGVSAAEPFTAAPAALRFVFTDGMAVGAASGLLGDAWSWSPGADLLDPLLESINLDALNGTAVFAAGGVHYRAVPDMLFACGASDAGYWAPHAAPLAAEVLAGDGPDTVLGGAADDRLLGEAGDDRLDGGEGADRLLGGDGADWLGGGPGQDTLEGQRGDDLLDGGDGNDLASGGSGGDTLLGGAGSDILIGYAGDDVLEGGGMPDLLIGGTNRDSAAGHDTARYAASPQKVSVDLAAGSGAGGDAEGDRLLGICDLEGSGFADSLMGDAQDNQLRGGGGADSLAGCEGADTLSGSRGDDWLDGGAGEDTAAYAGQAADFVITLSADRAWVRDLNPADGDEGTDALLGIERLQFADRMIRPAPPAAGGPRAVFTADDGATGRELWVTDGTAAGTRIVADIEPGRGGSDAFNFAAFSDGRAVFSATTTATGREPWITDGTEAGTHLLQDIGPGGSGSDPWEFVPLQDGRMIFAAAGPAGREPWITDGTAAGTHLLSDIDAAGGSSPGAFAVLRPGLAVFSAGDATAGREPWVTDGTEAGTQRLADLLPGTTGSDPYNFTQLGTGQAIFSAASPGHGNELWITDGTAANTRLVRDVAPGSAGSDPYGFFPLGDGRALFQAATAATGTELWITDGSAVGTQLVKDIAPGPSRGFPTAFTALGDGKVVFDAYADAGYDREVWITDGTAAGTQLLRDIELGPSGSFPQGFTALGDGRVVFAAETWSPDLLGRELWVTDGTATGTRLLRDLWPGTLDTAGDAPASGNPYPFLALGQGRAIFGASDAVHGGELWITDGTEAGTVLVGDIDPTPGRSGAPSYLTALGAGGAVPLADLALIA